MSSESQLELLKAGLPVASHDVYLKAWNDFTSNSSTDPQ